MLFKSTVVRTICAEKSSKCDFTTVDLAARASVLDLGQGELAIHAAINSTSKFLGMGSVAGFMTG
jgi:hypothetical protein